MPLLEFRVFWGDHCCSGFGWERQGKNEYVRMKRNRYDLHNCGIEREGIQGVNTVGLSCRP